MKVSHALASTLLMFVFGLAYLGQNYSSKSSTGYTVENTLRESDKLPANTLLSSVAEPQTLNKQLTNNWCKEMFSISKSYSGNNEHSRTIHSIIDKIAEETDSLIWSREPYYNLSSFLPSLIRKNLPEPNLTSLLQKVDVDEIQSMCEDMKRRGRQLGSFQTTDEEVATIKLCMLLNQRKYSYKLTTKGSRIQQMNGQLNYIPCKMKIKFTDKEISRCIGKSAEEKDGTVIIAFVGDSKIRQVFSSFLIETQYLNYSIINEVSIVWIIASVYGSILVL